jgi:hypothetical protein
MLSGFAGKGRRSANRSHWLCTTITGLRKSPYIVKPIGEWLITQVYSVLCLLIPVFEVRCPEDQKDGVAAQEERMGSVIDVLSAKIPRFPTSVSLSLPR